MVEDVVHADRAHEPALRVDHRRGRAPAHRLTTRSADLVALVLAAVLPQHLRTRLWAAALTVPLVWLIWALDLMKQVP